ncbi:MAG: 50S ribosomal protein L19 [Kiritimatiellae bacterium]|nr:50S ribosomal protein L19 [Kiritimatiellia bacterium]MDD5520251.1 50S ribosomal protein L19 [Kiritimatiellia bacterium]
MVSKILDKINKENMNEKKIVFSVGDTVKVHVKIKEGDKERVQIFPGTVIARDGGGATETFTVRRVSHGVGVERVFPVHSPYVVQIEVESSTKVKRAKLYYMRKLTGKKAKMKGDTKANA